MLIKNKCFACSRILDISFNLLRNIEGIDKLTQLKKLFLVNNKISKIENVSNLHQLQLLELGSNRIRVGVGASGVAPAGRQFGRMAGQVVGQVGQVGSGAVGFVFHVVDFSSGTGKLVFFKKNASRRSVLTRMGAQVGRPGLCT